MAKTLTHIHTHTVWISPQHTKFLNYSIKLSLQTIEILVGEHVSLLIFLVFFLDKSNKVGGVNALRLQLLMAVIHFLAAL